MRKEYYQTHREEILKKHKEYHLKHREEHLAYLKRYRQEHLEEIHAKDRERFRKQRELGISSYRYRKTAIQVLRSEIIRKLGGQCSNPFKKNHGDFLTETKCLQIDHINGKGNKQRKQFSDVKLYLKYVLEHLEEFQLLCANCNWLKKLQNHEV